MQPLLPAAVWPIQVSFLAYLIEGEPPTKTLKIGPNTANPQPNIYDINKLLFADMYIA